MPCTPVPPILRPDATDLIGPGATGYARLRDADGGDEIRARFRDLFPALSVELPVGDAPAMLSGPVLMDNPAYHPVNNPTVPECLPDVPATIERARENWRAIHRSMDLVSQNGGGKVLIPDVRDGQGNRVPFFWLGDIRIPEGVELVIDGLLKVPDGGLTDIPFFVDPDLEPNPDVPENRVQPKHTYVGFGWNGAGTPEDPFTPIRFAAISGSGIIDGNAIAFDANGDPDPTAAAAGRGNVGHPEFPSAWLNGDPFDVNDPDSWNDGPAQGITCCGVRWAGGKGGAGGPKPAPAFVRITGITVRNTLRSCFVGNLARVHLSGVRAENALTDHLYYFSPASEVDGARTAEVGANASDLHGSGYYWGGALILADAHVHGLTVTDIRPNPTASFTFTVPAGTFSYATRNLGAVVAPRHYRTTGSVTGLAVHADLVARATDAGLASVVAVRGVGFRVEGVVYHTGNPDTADPADSTTTLVQIGAPYLHRVATGGAVRLAAHRLPGKTRLFRNDGQEFDGLDLHFAVDYHPATVQSDSLVILTRSGQGLRLHVDAPERAPAGGGPAGLLRIRQTTALAVGEGDLAPETDTVGPLPPARGFHDVTVSGRVQNGAAWCDIIEGDDALVSGLVARDLTVVDVAGGTPDAERWTHDRVTYLRFTPAAPPDVAWRPAPKLRKDHVFVFPHETSDDALGRIRVASLKVRIVDDPTESDGSFVPVFGVVTRRSATESAVYVDPTTLLPGGTNDLLEAEVTFTPDTYVALRGHVDAVITFTPSGAGPWYKVAHGLAAAPTMAEAVWSHVLPLNGTLRLESVPLELRADRATHVWVKLDSGLTDDQQLHLRARIGVIAGGI